MARVGEWGAAVGMIGDTSAERGPEAGIELRWARFELGEVPRSDPPPLKPGMLCREVHELLAREPDFFALAIVQDDRPIGLVNRIDVLARFSEPYMHELFDRRSVTHIMDWNPLILPVEADVELVARQIAVRKMRAMHSGWILTRDGRYAGIGNSLSLLHMWLEHIERKNVELESARAQAEQASRAKSSFLAHVSHELRTPLNAIMGFSEIIARRILGPIGNERYASYAHDIHASGGRLLSMIDDLLDLSKAEAGRMELTESRVELATTAAEALRMVEARARQGAVGLRSELTGNLPAVLQIWMNLASNAVKFTSAGGEVALRAGLGPDDGVWLAVSDSGIGMSAVEIARALEPFGQVDNLYNKKHVGTGLGLPLVKAIAELHGGWLKVESEPGRGTTITVGFPPDRTLA
jgi:two-component system, cell cycle sensor histidine kinase PleC